MEILLYSVYRCGIMNILVKVGCCGFPGGMNKYFEQFKVVEVQRTFYKPPKDTTVEKWREKAPNDFEFTIKAWQVITHPSSSPTYRKAGLSLSANEAELVGFFKPSDVVFNAWQVIYRICKILESRICIFQTPTSFKPTDENIQNMKEFFKKIERGNLVLGWEPRGPSWSNDIVKELCKSLNLIHVVDPFNMPPSIYTNVLYFRLHGAPPGKKLYSYKYTESDFVRLHQMLHEIRDNHNVKEIYIMFNNIYMRDDALAFIEYLKNDKTFQVYGASV